MKVKLAFYKGTGIIDRLVQIATKSKYSHIEIVVGDYAYSSDFKSGVYKRMAIYNDKWDFIDLSIPYPTSVKVFYNQTKNCKYDFLGALGVVLPLREKENRWECAEWVSNALKISGCKKFFKYNCAHLSPQKIFEIASKF